MLTRRDPIGLLAARSTSTPAVDLHMVVAKRVNPDNPDRQLAKQPVQQYPYGATNRGRAERIQEVKEDRGDDVPADPKEALKLYYVIGEAHRKAIEDELPGAKETMKFLQKIARELAKVGVPLEWTSPTGFPFANRYEEPTYKDVESILRGVRVHRTVAIEPDEPVVRVSKSSNAVAANVIHSLEASHMMLTATACKRAGIPLMGIHDCYLGLAPQVEKLDSIIKQGLLQIYEGRNHLVEIRDCALRSWNGRSQKNPLAGKAKRAAAIIGTKTPNFRDVPTLGDFDLREILKNPYLFS
jgi:DNA-directed RNA polymerase